MTNVPSELRDEIPSFDEQPARVWDWRHPQFLAGF